MIHINNNEITGRLEFTEITHRGQGKHHKRHRLVADFPILGRLDMIEEIIGMAAGIIEGEIDSLLTHPPSAPAIVGREVDTEIRFQPCSVVTAILGHYISIDQCYRLGSRKGCARGIDGRSPETPALAGCVGGHGIQFAGPLMAGRKGAFESSLGLLPEGSPGVSIREIYPSCQFSRTLVDHQRESIVFASALLEPLIQTVFRINEVEQGARIVHLPSQTLVKEVGGQPVTAVKDKG